MSGTFPTNATTALSETPDPLAAGAREPRHPGEDAGDELDPGLLAEVLKDVIDPELGVNIIDLGMVYQITVDETDAVTVDMTLTSPACPMADLLELRVLQALQAQERVSSVKINWVGKPAWGPHRITEDGREQLRCLGFNV